MKFFILLSFSFVSFSVLGQSLFKEHCGDDVSKLCPSLNSSQEHFDCLVKNKNNLSVKCGQELDRLAAILKNTGTRGSGGLSSFSGLMGGMGLAPAKKKIITYSGSYAPEHDPAAVQQHKLTFSTPLWAQGKESFAMSLNSGRVHFDRSQNWKNETIKTPRTLDRVELGGQYSRQLENSRLLGIRGSVGSASDKIFYDTKEITFSLNATYTKPAGDNNFWILTAFMSNNNPFLNYIPIPGFIYLKKTENFTGMFGLPFLSMQWTPAKSLMFSTSFFITNFNSDVTYLITDKFQVFSGFAITQQTFLRQERRNLQERLFFNEKKVYVGLRIPMGGQFSGDIQVGETFDRKLREGKRYNDSSLSADYGRSWYQSLSLTMLY